MHPGIMHPGNIYHVAFANIRITGFPLRIR